MSIWANITLIHRRERRGRREINKAIHYKKEFGRYPQTLQELLPKFVTDLKKPDDYWGWLYLPTDQDFTLGYVFGVDKWGYSVCVIHSMKRNWDCFINSTGPLKLKPTPFPTSLPPR